MQKELKTFISKFCEKFHRGADHVVMKLKAAMWCLSVCSATSDQDLVLQICYTVKWVRSVRSLDILTLAVKGLTQWDQRPVSSWNIFASVHAVSLFLGIFLSYFVQFWRYQYLWILYVTAQTLLSQITVFHRVFKFNCSCGLNCIVPRQTRNAKNRWQFE